MAKLRRGAIEGEILQVEGFWKVIPLFQFRETDKVDFHLLPMDMFQDLRGIDRVKHSPNAKSPGIVGSVEGWYLHPHQQDNLMIMTGTRTSILIRKEPFSEKEVFEITSDYVKRNGKLIFDGPAILRWEINVYHQVSSESDGSLSINFAQRYPGFSLKHEFDIFDLDLKTGESKVVREGYLDQMTGT